MGRRRHETCARCGQSFPEEHKCPPIIIHELSEEKIVILGEQLSLKWEDETLVIYSKKEADK